MNPLRSVAWGSLVAIVGLVALLAWNSSPPAHSPVRESLVVYCAAGLKPAVEAAARRDEVGVPVAVARVEQLYPWPTEALARELERYPNCTEIVWLQEEPENMGAWNQVKGELYGPYEDRYQVRRVSRADEASPATGSHAIHQQEQSMLVDRALAAPGS